MREREKKGDLKEEKEELHNIICLIYIYTLYVKSFSEFVIPVGENTYLRGPTDQRVRRDGRQHVENTRSRRNGRTRRADGVEFVFKQQIRHGLHVQDTGGTGEVYDGLSSGRRTHAARSRHDFRKTVHVLGHLVRRQGHRHAVPAQVREQGVRSGVGRYAQEHERSERIDSEPKRLRSIGPHRFRSETYRARGFRGRYDYPGIVAGWSFGRFTAEIVRGLVRVQSANRTRIPTPRFPYRVRVFLLGHNNPFETGRSHDGRDGKTRTHGGLPLQHAVRDRIRQVHQTPDRVRHEPVSVRDDYVAESLGQHGRSACVLAAHALRVQEPDAGPSDRVVQAARPRVRKSVPRRRGNDAER